MYRMFFLIMTVRFERSIDRLNLTIDGDSDDLTQDIFRSSGVFGSYKHIEVRDGIRSLGDGTFKDCKNLISILLSNSIESMGKEVFLSCDNLKSVILPNKVPSILENSFQGCYNIVNITIPASVTSIAQSHTFLSLNSLERIIIDPGNKVYHMSTNGQVLLKGTSGITCIGAIETLIIPAEVQELKSCFINGRKKIKYIYILSLGAC